MFALYTHNTQKSDLNSLYTRTELLYNITLYACIQFTGDNIKCEINQPLIDISKIN